MDDEDRQQLLLVLECLHVITAAVVAVHEYSRPYYDKIPYHTSALSGADWVGELLDGHPNRIRNELGVDKQVFSNLIIAMQDHGLRSSPSVMLEEQLAIFLYTCVTGITLHHAGERFQRRTSTMSRQVVWVSD
jgi:hypothetical protein